MTDGPAGPHRPQTRSTSFLWGRREPRVRPGLTEDLDRRVRAHAPGLGGRPKGTLRKPGRGTRGCLTGEDQGHGQEAGQLCAVRRCGQVRQVGKARGRRE